MDLYEIFALISIRDGPIFGRQKLGVLHYIFITFWDKVAGIKASFPSTDPHLLASKFC